MSNSSGFLDFVLEQLDAVGTLKASRLFGGTGIKVGEVNFAFVVEDTLYLRAEGELSKRLKVAGGRAFSFMKGGKRMELKYISVDGETLEDRDKMEELGRAALEVARAAKVPAPKKKPAPPARPKGKRRTSS